MTLMEEWNMATSLSANDLAGATTYWKSTAAQLWEILDLAWSECTLEREFGWRNKVEKNLYYASKVIPPFGVCLQYGFDFERDDDGWSVPRLLVPSAYVALYETDSYEGQLNVPSDWKPPADDRWNEYTHVKQIQELSGLRHSLSEPYISFFVDGLNGVNKLLNQSEKSSTKK